MKKTITSLVLALAPTLSFADESWTGFNAGIQLGEVDVSSGVNATGNSTVGLHAGYLHDFDGYVLGGEASYDLGGKIVSDEQVKKVDTLRLKVKGGHVFGRAFVYGVVGYAGMDGDAGNMDGYSVGIGRYGYLQHGQGQNHHCRLRATLRYTPSLYYQDSGMHTQLYLNLPSGKFA